MPKKRIIGLYLGVNSVGGVVIENKKVVAASTQTLSSLDMGTKLDTLGGEAINEDIKWEALINKLLRDINAEEKEVYVSFSDKDFIFRAFEMPLMSDKEVTTSLIFEIEKYIPFKLDELRWDYSYIRSPKEKKIYVSFLGIKESNFQRLAGIFSHLSLTPRVIESSSISLLRVLDSVQELSSLNNFALLDFTPLESYITFFSQRLPVFNRYFIINKNEGEIDIERFIESVRFSFQYFKREFKSYELDKLIVIASSLEETVKNSLQEELQTEIKVLTPADFIQVADSSIENLKALGVASRDYSSFKFRPFIRTTESHITGEGVETRVFLNRKLISFFISLGLIATVGTFFYLKYQAFQAHDKVVELGKKLSVPVAFKDVSWEGQQVLMSKIDHKLQEVKKIHQSSPQIVEFIKTLQTLAPKGVWLDNLDMASSDDGKSVNCNIRGNVFLGDAYEERATINNLIALLKEAEAVKKLFKSLEMRSSERQKIGEFTVTSFVLEFR